MSLSTTFPKLACAGVLFGIMALASPVAAAADGPREIVVGGTGSALAAIKTLGAAFSANTPDVKVRVVPSLGSGGGIKAVAAGAIQIGLSSRPINDDERAKGLVERETIRTPFVFAVHQQAQVNGVSLAELAELYSGGRKTWADGSRVRPVLRPPTDVDTQIVAGMSPALRDAIGLAHQAPGKNVAVTDTDTADELERVPGSVGTSSLLLILAEKRSLKALAVDGVEATVKNMNSGKYPHHKSIYVVTQRQPSADAQAFAAFITSAAAAALIGQMGGLQVGPSP